jgi:hypothetical protein
LERNSLEGVMKVVGGLSSWSLLGAFLAAFVGFGAYMYGGFDTSSANQAGVGEYIIPELEVAQVKQPSEGLSQTTKDSSSGTEAAEYTLSAEDTLPIFDDSGSTEPSTDSVVPIETSTSGDPLKFSEASIPPLPVQAAGISTPADSCTSQGWCANPAHQVPNEDNATTKKASSCTGDNDKDSCSKKKEKKKKKKK